MIQHSKRWVIDKEVISAVLKAYPLLKTEWHQRSKIRTIWQGDPTLQRHRKIRHKGLYMLVRLKLIHQASLKMN